MKKHAAEKLILAGALMAGLTGCLGASGEIVQSESPNPVERSSDHLGANSSALNKIFEYKQGNKALKIYQSETGESVSEESYPPNENPLLNETMHGKTLAEIHRLLLPDEEVPEIVKKSDWTYQAGEQNNNGMDSDLLIDPEPMFSNGETQNDLPLRKTSDIWDSWFQDNYCYSGTYSFCLPNQNFYWTQQGYSNIKHSAMRLMVYAGSEAKVEVWVGGVLVTNTVQFASNLVIQYKSTSPSYTTWYGSKDFRLRTHTYKVSSQNTGLGWSKWHWTGKFDNKTFTTLPNS